MAKRTEALRPFHARRDTPAVRPSHRRYQALVEQTLARLLPADAPLALLDFPYYNNPGDAAIWCGTLVCLEARMQRRIIARHDQVSMLSKPIRFPADTVILIQGGGNFGDLWPHHQRLRTEILRRYPAHRVVQLPQSIHYHARENLERDCRLFNAHPDFHIMCRDAESAALAEAHFAASVHLAPDMAHFLFERIKRRPAQTTAVGFLRTDIESLDFAELAMRAGLPLAPWTVPQTTPTALLEALARIPAISAPVRLDTANILRRALFDRLAWRRVRAACKSLSVGERFASDRLHCHILGDLMGIEHVMLDNSYRKIGRYIQSWPAVTRSAYHGDDLQAALTAIGFGEQV